MNKTILLMGLLSFLWGATSSAKIQISDFSESRHNEYYQKGSDLIAPFMQLHAEKIKKPEKTKILNGISYLDAVTKINPQNWAAYWIKGKGYQALSNDAAAYQEFLKAYDIQKENADVARELMITCLNLGKASEGVSVALHAMELEPDNSGLTANAGLAYLIQGNLELARFHTERAIALDPRDEINKQLLEIVSDVESGKRKQPKTYSDLTK